MDDEKILILVVCSEFVLMMMMMNIEFLTGVVGNYYSFVE